MLFPLRQIGSRTDFCLVAARELRELTPILGCTQRVPMRARNGEIVYNMRILPGLACRGFARRHLCQQRSPGLTTSWTMACRAAGPQMETQQMPSNE